VKYPIRTMVRSWPATLNLYLTMQVRIIKLVKVVTLVFLPAFSQGCFRVAACYVLGTVADCFPSLRTSLFSLALFFSFPPFPPFPFFHSFSSFLSFPFFSPFLSCFSSFLPPFLSLLLLSLSSYFLFLLSFPLAFSSLPLSPFFSSPFSNSFFTFCINPTLLLVTQQSSNLQVPSVSLTAGITKGHYMGPTNKN